MTNIDITNITPFFDTECTSDALRFNLDGVSRHELLSGNGICENEDSRLEDLGEQMETVRGFLAQWIRDNVDERFEVGSTNPEISSIEHGVFVSDGVVVWLSRSASRRLKLEGEAFQVKERCGCAFMTWEDQAYGYQELEFSPGGTDDYRILGLMLTKPEIGISDIEDRLEALRDENSTIYKLYWASEDSQGTIDIGEYSSEEEAENAKDDALTELISQCGTDEDRAGINAGSFTII
ncbi:hypothetical protein G3A39_38420 [Paraburkholderia aspalathi]|nr:hypothetical protein [Paraburkholderia aspalathi]